MTRQNEFRIVGVVEKAQELHCTAHQIGFGGVLGKYIASLGFKVYREKKAWKGQMTEVNCYEDSAELAWKWLGFTRKENCVQLLKSDFVVDEDFLLKVLNSSQSGGRPSDKYYITVECFKMLGMMVGTAKGKEIRRYFLKCEKVAKAAFTTSSESDEARRVKERAEGKTDRKLMTDRIAQWLEENRDTRKPEEDHRIYIVVSDLLNERIFGLPAKKIKMLRDPVTGATRDSMNWKELKDVAYVERLFCSFMDQGSRPLNAMYKALDFAKIKGHSLRSEYSTAAKAFEASH